MDHGNQFWLLASFERTAHIVWSEDLTPRGLHGDRFPATPFHHIDHTRAKYSIKLTKQVSIPALPVPDIGRVRELVV